MNEVSMYREFRKGFNFVRDEFLEKYLMESEHVFLFRHHWTQDQVMRACRRVFIGGEQR
jgi:hypothetical protein